MKKSITLAFAVLAALFMSSMAMASNVTFQVNMSIQQQLGAFTPGTNQIVVRGSFQGWAGNANELTDAGNGLYTGTWDIPQGTIEYKFVIVGGANDVWESVNNRTADVPSGPITLPVVYFNDQSSGATADVEVNFRVNMTVQDLTNAFDPAVDWVVVRGNHANLGNWGGETRLLEETGNPGVYSLRIQFDDVVTNSPIEYKFVFIRGGSGGESNWESSNNRSFTPTGTEPDVLPPPNGNGYGEINPDIVYFSNVGPDDIITRDLNVIFQVETTPLVGRLAAEGYVFDVQSGDTVFSIAEIDAAGFFNNWPWGNFGPAHTMNDDGTEGDQSAGDGIWSKSILFPAGSPRILIYKYGCNDLDVEAGFARNHERYLDDSQDTYRMPVDCWGSPDTLYNDWACTVSAVEENPTATPSNFTLEQNYPNPFNPNTNIAFTLPRESNTTLVIYDLLGRVAATMNYGKMSAGTHAVEFNASALSTGVYFYRLEAGDFSATRKMLLLK